MAHPPLARGEPLKAAPSDRAAIEACLKLAQAKAKMQAQERTIENEPPGPAGRLEAAAKDAAVDPASCIGAVSIPCQQEPGGISTAGMIACTGREWAVWDERLNAAYRQALKDSKRERAKVLRDTQRAWLLWREHKCKLPALDNEGGSIVGPLFASCMSEATARQALWLEDGRDPDAAPR